MSYFLVFLMITAVCYSFKSGNFDMLQQAALDCGSDAVNLVSGLLGPMMLWGGLMKIACESGISSFLTKAVKPITNKIFKDLNNSPGAADSIALNITANLLGLGNAATPLGLDAVKKLQGSPQKTARKNLTVLIVINACSIQLIPTTVSAIRSMTGSAEPMRILPCVLLVSAVSLIVAVITAEVLESGN